LEPRYLPLVIAALGVWLLLARSFWRGHFLERFLGLG
jgi:hypothetical protein